MDKFLDYIQSNKKLTQFSNLSSTSVHIIIGNESCDLDSMVSSLALAYYYYCLNDNKIIIPVMNIASHEMLYRTENLYVLRKVNIDHTNLIFRNTLDLSKIEDFANVSVSLVDHHILDPKDVFLSKFVHEIYDHRPLDKCANWDLHKVNMIIEQVGSCCTLIAKKFIDSNFDIGTTLAKLFFDVIAFDTVGFNPEAGRAKNLDIIVIQELVKQYNLNFKIEESFDELWKAHNDVFHLTPMQLLNKDLKTVNGIPMAALPMLVETYLAFSNIMETLENFCEVNKNICLILMGLAVTKTDDVSRVNRDIAIYSPKENTVANEIVTNLNNALQLKGYSFDLEETMNTSNLIHFKQKNTKLTRKHIVPIIKDTLTSINNSNK